MMHKAPGPFGPLGFVSYDRSSIDNSPSCSGFRSYQGVAPPPGVDQSFPTPHPYYTPTFSSSTPYHHLGSIGFRPVPQQTHFTDPQAFVDYRYYSNQPPTLAPTYENTRYNHMFDATTQPFRSHLPQGPSSSSSSTFLVDHPSGPRPGPTTAMGPSSATFSSSHLINPSYSLDGVESIPRVTSSPTRHHHSNALLRSPDVVEKIVHQSSSSCYTSTSSGNDVSSPEVTSRQTTTMTKKKKRPLAVPEEQKDGQYWARRRKNNESAKKSRETRRVKAAVAEKRMKGLEEEVERKRTIWKLLHKELKELKSMPSSSSTVW